MKQTNLSLRNARNARSGLAELCEYIKAYLNKTPITVVEVGAFSGDSGRIFAANFDQVYSVDPWMSNYDPTGVDLASNPEYYDMREVEVCFDQMAEEMGNVTKMKMLSEDASLKFADGSVDVVYIDALHTDIGVTHDISLWIKKIRKPGVICGHDYGSKHYPGVRKAVDAYFYKSPIDETFFDSSWAKRLED